MSVKKSQTYASKTLTSIDAAMHPTEEHLELINQLTRTEKRADELVVFPVYAMNSMRDRDWDRFTAKTVKEFAELPPPGGPIGKSFLDSHWHGQVDGNVGGRIYKSDAVKREGISHLKLWLYMPNTDQYKSLIENIDFGIYWAVSVGVGVKEATCNICDDPWGSDFYACENGHEKGVTYDDEEAERLLIGAEEFYELSRCYLGAQYQAEFAQELASAGQPRTRKYVYLTEKSAQKIFAKEAGEGEEDMDNLQIGKADDVEKSVVPFKSFPLAPEEAPWSFTASDGNAILGDNDNWAAYKSVHTWFDAENPEARASYKLPSHKKLDGSIKTVMRGVMAAGNALMGARGGTNIPSGDVNGCKNHLSRHYKEFDREAPWDSKSFMELFEAQEWVVSEDEDFNLVLAYNTDSFTYDGKELVRKEGGEQVNPEEKELAEWLLAERDARIAELEANGIEREAEVAEAEQSHKAEVEELSAKAALGEKVLSAERDEVVRYYKLAHKKEDNDDEVDTSFVGDLITACGANFDLIRKLKDEYKGQAEGDFPKVRRSTYEEEPKDGEKKGDTSFTKGRDANSLHNADKE